MTRDDLLQALGELDLYVAERNRIIDLAIYGGSTLMLVSNFRLSSGDADAVAQTDRGFIDQAARFVAGRLDLPDDWLNDGVRTYLSPNVDHPDHHLFFRSFPDEQCTGIRIYVATADYMLAMKLMSLRIGPDDSKDLADILNLCRVTGIDTAPALIDLAAMFYPEAKVRAFQEINDPLWLFRSSKINALRAFSVAFNSFQSLSGKLRLSVEHIARSASHETAPRYIGQSGESPQRW